MTKLPKKKERQYNSKTGSYNCILFNTTILKKERGDNRWVTTGYHMNLLLSSLPRFSRKISYPASKAGITAWVLAEADARGVSSHGVTRLKVYRNELERDTPIPQPILK